jgi:hypothetical protein
MGNGNRILGFDVRAGCLVMHACMQWNGKKEVREELQIKEEEGGFGTPVIAPSMPLNSNRR